MPTVQRPTVASARPQYNESSLVQLMKRCDSELLKKIGDDMALHLKQPQCYRFQPGEGFQIHIPTAEGGMWQTRASVNDLKARVYPDLKYTRRGTIAVKQPRRPLDKCYLWWVAQNVHYGLGFPLTGEDAKLAVQQALRAGVLKVPPQLRDIEQQQRASYCGWQAVSSRQAQHTSPTTLPTINNAARVHYHPPTCEDENDQSTNRHAFTTPYDNNGQPAHNDNNSTSTYGNCSTTNPCDSSSVRDVHGFRVHDDNLTTVLCEDDDPIPAGDDQMFCSDNDVTIFNDHDNGARHSESTIQNQRNSLEQADNITSRLSVDTDFLTSMNHIGQSDENDCITVAVSDRYPSPVHSVIEPEPEPWKIVKQPNIVVEIPVQRRPRTSFGPPTPPNDHGVPVKNTNEIENNGFESDYSESNGSNNEYVTASEKEGSEENEETYNYPSDSSFIDDDNVDRLDSSADDLPTEDEASDHDSTTSEEEIVVGKSNVRTRLQSMKKHRQRHVISNVHEPVDLTNIETDTDTEPEVPRRPISIRNRACGKSSKPGNVHKNKSGQKHEAETRTMTDAMPIRSSKSLDNTGQPVTSRNIRSKNEGGENISKKPRGKDNVGNSATRSRSRTLSPGGDDDERNSTGFDADVVAFTSIVQESSTNHRGHNDGSSVRSPNDSLPSPGLRQSLAAGNTVPMNTSADIHRGYFGSGDQLQTLKSSGKITINSASAQVPTKDPKTSRQTSRPRLKRPKSANKGYYIAPGPPGPIPPKEPNPETVRRHEQMEEADRILQENLIRARKAQSNNQTSNPNTSGNGNNTSTHAIPKRSKPQTPRDQNHPTKPIGSSNESRPSTIKMNVAQGEAAGNELKTLKRQSFQAPPPRPRDIFEVEETPDPERLPRRSDLESRKRRKTRMTNIEDSVGGSSGSRVILRPGEGASDPDYHRALYNSERTYEQESFFDAHAALL